MNYNTSDEMIEHYWEDVMVLLLEMSLDPWTLKLHDDSLVCDFIEEEEEYFIRFRY